MSSTASHQRRAQRSRARSRARRGSRRQLRLRGHRISPLALAAVIAIATIGVIAAIAPLTETIREITLPLRHEDIIRQQARDKKVDASLIASVIFEESKFRDQT